jgi:hypothetical protein
MKKGVNSIMFFAESWNKSMADLDTADRGQEGEESQGRSTDGGGPGEAMEVDEGLVGVRRLFTTPPPSTTPPPNNGETDRGEDVTERAREFIARKKEDEKRRLRDLVACDWLEYDTITKRNEEDMKADKTTLGMEAKCINVGSFTEPLDGRLAITGLKIFRGNRSAVTTSFDERSLKCRGCSGHEGEVAWRPRGQDGRRQVIFLTDQCYPPVLPAHGGATCIKIIRREYGSLNQLVAELTDLARGKALAKESLILIFAGAQLARVGTAAYIEDLIAAVASIKAVLGQDLKVAPLPPFFLGGCDSMEAVRSCAELAMWSDCVFKEEDGLMRGSLKRAAKLLEAGEGMEAQPDYRARMRLPASTRPAEGKKVWEMGGFSLRKSLRPASAETEADLILGLLEEIRAKMAINLDVAPSFDRKLPAANEARAVRSEKLYLAVGGQHAQSIAEAMRRKGDVVDVVVIPGWKATTVGIRILEDKMKEAMARRKPEVIVISCLDDNIYFGMGEDGATQAAKADELGKEHIEGRLVVGKKDAQELLFRRLDPIWKATEGLNTIVVCPMARYVCKPCCEGAEHVTNRMEPDFVNNVRQDLREVVGGLKKYFSTTGRSRCQVLDPNVDLSQVEARLVWAEDPIYPLPIGYDKVATGVKLVEGKIGARMLVVPKRPRSESASGPSRAMAPRMEETTRTREYGYGRPAVDFRYQSRPEDGGWSRTPLPTRGRGVASRGRAGRRGERNM